MPRFLSPARFRIGLATALLAAVFLLGGMFSFRPRLAGEATAPCDTRSQPLEPLAPGTVVGGVAPEGWSHLVIKSNPRVATGDVECLSDRVKELASLYFTVLVADVVPRREGGEVRYHLDRVGAGLGARIGGTDRILTPETQRQLGANLDFLASSALGLAHDKVKAMRLVARSPAFALLDAPVLLLQEGKHRPAIFRYALLVEPYHGKLETLLWGFARDGENERRDAIGVLEWLAQDDQQDCLLHVDARELGLFGVPREQAIAQQRIPRGQQQLRPTPEVRELGALSRLTPEQAAELERQLRRLLP